MAPNLHLAHVSGVLLTWAVFCYAFAMLGYAAEFASNGILLRARMDPDRKSHAAARLLNGNHSCVLAANFVSLQSIKFGPLCSPAGLRV